MSEQKKHQKPEVEAHGNHFPPKPSEQPEVESHGISNHKPAEDAEAEANGPYKGNLTGFGRIKVTLLLLMLTLSMLAIVTANALAGAYRGG
jgi:hypothetical protein